MNSVQIGIFDFSYFEGLDFTNYKVPLLIGGVIVFFLFLLAIISRIERHQQFLRRKQLHQDLHRLSNTVSEMSIKTFLHLRNAHQGGQGRKHISSNYDFPGIYIIHNLTKDKYYVGQGVKLFRRANNHFTGHGNGDVYADYKYGDDFTIKLIPLAGSGFRSLNELERQAIYDYRANITGYNKTKGNQG